MLAIEGIAAIIKNTFVTKGSSFEYIASTSKMLGLTINLPTNAIKNLLSKVNSFHLALLMAKPMNNIAKGVVMFPISENGLMMSEGMENPQIKNNTPKIEDISGGEAMLFRVAQLKIF